MAYHKPTDSDRIVKLLLQRQHNWNRYGNRKAFCGGNIMIGPIRSWWWLLEIWTVIVGVVFISEYAEYNYGIFVGGVSIFGICVISCLIISFGDPGVLVKPSFAEAYKNAKEVTSMLNSGLPTPYKTVAVGKKLVKYSYCTRCHHFRPPHTAHCHICDSCIENWDHHCPVFGGCVGRKNLVAFHLMCMSQAVIWAYWLTCSAFAAANAVREEDSPLDAVQRSKTLVGVVLGFLGAATLPLILSRTPLERDLCVPKAKSSPAAPLVEMTGHGDWSILGVPAPHWKDRRDSDKCSSSNTGSSDGLDTASECSIKVNTPNSVKDDQYAPANS